MLERKSTLLIKRVLQTAPLVMVGICVLIYFAFFRGVTVEDILKFTPENLWLAALVMVGLFALKSLSMFFPMLVLIAATGSIFPSVVPAIFVNSIGVAVMLLIPYAIGRFAEKDFVQGLINKNKNADKLREIKAENELFIAYFLRVINILPCDLVSMFLGSTGFGFVKYLAGSFAGVFPGMVATTIIGANMSDPTSPAFWIAVGTEVVFAVSSTLAYYFYKKKKA
ncbi:MAG: TVP38/TMEM64 family protein [Oscillospiraceae bacterium]|nr:TVP38/TMEM64 family protein [Oscillospiraceae bacterium]